MSCAVLKAVMNVLALAIDVAVVLLHKEVAKIS